MAIKLPNQSNLKSNRFNKLAILLFVNVLVFLGFAQQSFAQVDAFITNKGATTICQGESTTLQVIISASASPYTVVYSNGTSLS